MLTIDEILTKAELITLETQIDSITPMRVGELFTSLAEQLRLGVVAGATIGASKLSELADVMLLNNKDNDILQKIGTKWTNIQLDINKINQIASFWKLDTNGNLYTDLNVYSKQGLSAYGSGTGGSGSSGSVTVYNGLDSQDTLLALSANMGRVLNETKLNISAISSWALSVSKPAYAISEITGLTAEFSRYSLTTHAHAWSAITDKPSTFAPSAHTHLWANITDKPATFTPSAHTHTKSQITDFTHSHAFADLTSKPTTLSGYGITDALLSTAYTASDVLSKLKTVDGSGSGLDADLLDGKDSGYYAFYDERTLGNNLNFNALAYDFHNKSFIVSPVHSKNFTGQTNFPFDDYGQMITFGGLNTYFPFQLAVSENVTKLKIRSKYRPYNNTVMDSVWVDIYTSNNANRSDVNWTANTLIATTDITLNALASTDKSVKNFINKFNSMFDIDVNGNIVAKTNLYSVGGISAYQSGAGISGLTLQGNMNANGKNITGASTVQAGNAIIGNDPVGVIDYMSPGLYNADNDGVIAAYSVTEEVYLYGNGYMSIDNTGLTTVPKMSATEYKFGRYKFMEDTNGDLGIYNGTTKIATILKTRTNSNL